MILNSLGIIRTKVVRTKDVRTKDVRTKDVRTKDVRAKDVRTKVTLPLKGSFVITGKINVPFNKIAAILYLLKSFVLQSLSFQFFHISFGILATT